MELLGARLAYLEETGPNQRLDTNKIKRLVGTPVIKARALYKAPVEFKATHTLALTTNNLPTVTETDHGTWRRLKLVPFDVTYTDATKGTTLRGRVLHDPSVQEAVLAWMVSGAGDWFRSGSRLPAVPATISAATKEWREEGDLLFSFLPRNLISDPPGFVELRPLLDAFNLDLPVGQHPWGLASFRSRVSDHPAMRDLGGMWGKHPTNRTRSGRCCWPRVGGAEPAVGRQPGALRRTRRARTGGVLPLTNLAPSGAHTSGPRGAGHQGRRRIGTTAARWGGSPGPVCGAGDCRRYSQGRRLLRLPARVVVACLSPAVTRTSPRSAPSVPLCRSSPPPAPSTT